MISMPFLQGLPLIYVDWAGGLNTVTVATDGALTSRQNADNDPAHLNPLLYEFVSGSYVTSAIMQSGHGYWVENVTSGVIYLIFQSDSMNSSKSGGSGPIYTSLSSGAVQPPGPPGSIGSSSSSSKSGCGLLGPELLLLALGRFAFHRLRRRRTLGA